MKQYETAARESYQTERGKVNYELDKMNLSKKLETREQEFKKLCQLREDFINAIDMGDDFQGKVPKEAQKILHQQKVLEGLKKRGEDALSQEIIDLEEEIEKKKEAFLRSNTEKIENLDNEIKHLTAHNIELDRGKTKEQLAKEEKAKKAKPKNEKELLKKKESLEKNLEQVNEKQQSEYLERRSQLEAEMDDSQRRLRKVEELGHSLNSPNDIKEAKAQLLEEFNQERKAILQEIKDYPRDFAPARKKGEELGKKLKTLDRAIADLKNLDTPELDGQDPAKAKKQLKRIRKQYERIVTETRKKHDDFVESIFTDLEELDKEAKSKGLQRPFPDLADKSKPWKEDQLQKQLQNSFSDILDKSEKQIADYADGKGLDFDKGKFKESFKENTRDWLRANNLPDDQAEEILKELDDNFEKAWKESRSGVALKKKEFLEKATKQMVRRLEDTGLEIAKTGPGKKFVKGLAKSGFKAIPVIGMAGDAYAVGEDLYNIQKIVFEDKDEFFWFDMTFEVIHLVTDAIGFVPVIGDAVSLVGDVIYMSKALPRLMYKMGWSDFWDHVDKVFSEINDMTYEEKLYYDPNMGGNPDVKEGVKDGGNEEGSNSGRGEASEGSTEDSEENGTAPKGGVDSDIEPPSIEDQPQKGTKAHNFEPLTSTGGEILKLNDLGYERAEILKEEDQLKLLIIFKESKIPEQFMKVDLKLRVQVDKKSMIFGKAKKYDIPRIFEPEIAFEFEEMKDDNQEKGASKEEEKKLPQFDLYNTKSLERKLIYTYDEDDYAGVLDLESMKEYKVTAGGEHIFDGRLDDIVAAPQDPANTDQYAQDTPYKAEMKFYITTPSEKFDTMASVVDYLAQRFKADTGSDEGGQWVIMRTVFRRKNYYPEANLYDMVVSEADGKKYLEKDSRVTFMGRQEDFVDKKKDWAFRAKVIDGRDDISKNQASFTFQLESKNEKWIGRVENNFVITAPIFPMETIPHNQQKDLSEIADQTPVLIKLTNFDVVLKKTGNKELDKNLFEVEIVEIKNFKKKQEGEEQERKIYVKDWATNQYAFRGLGEKYYMPLRNESL